MPNIFTYLLSLKFRSLLLNFNRFSVLFHFLAFITILYVKQFVFQMVWAIRRRKRTFKSSQHKCVNLLIKADCRTWFQRKLSFLLLHFYGKENKFPEKHDNNNKTNQIRSKISFYILPKTLQKKNKKVYNRYSNQNNRVQTK
jgi:hypothetical protein